MQTGSRVAIVDLEAFNDPIERALAAGIPVVSYNADAPNARLAYVGQDLYGSGFEMGKRIVELVGEGDVALFIATPGQLNIQPRIDGAIAAIEESGASINVEDIATGATLEEELSTIEAYYLGNTGVAGMFAVDAGSTQGVGQVVQTHDARAAGLKGCGGYDLLPTTVELVSEGVLDFTIDQQPYLQGFLPVQYLYLSKLSGGVVLPPETNTGLVFLIDLRYETERETTKHEQNGETISVGDGYCVNAKTLRAFAKRLWRMSPGKFAKLSGVPARRVTTLPAAALVMDRVIKRLAPERAGFWLSECGKGGFTHSCRRRSAISIRFSRARRISVCRRQGFRNSGRRSPSGRAGSFPARRLQRSGCALPLARSPTSPGATMRMSARSRAFDGFSSFR